MSNNEKHGSAGTIVPYVRIERVIEILSIMYRNSVKEKKLEELAALCGCKISNLNNVTPTITILGLGEVRKGIISLTPDGLVFADACVSNDLQKAKQIIRKNISKSAALMFVKSLLETRASISGDEIGRALAERFKKSWKDIRTSRNFGNSCASILSFGGLGYYYDGVLSSKPPVVKASSSLYAPEVTYKSLCEILNALHGFERARINEISKRLKQHESMIPSGLTIGVILNLVEREANNSYHLTDIGEKLIDPVIDNEQKVIIFRDCLLSSPYFEIIEKLSKTKDELSTNEIGDILSFHLKREWSDETKTLYSNKFLSWSNQAGITKKLNRGIYKINKEIIKKIALDKDKSIETKENIPNDLPTIYELGRTVGNLESIITGYEKKRVFMDNVGVLKELLANHNDLLIVLEMLEKNFEIAMQTNNLDLCKSEINFLRGKIKEKFGIEA